jgi:hypothetical protein
MSTAEQAGTSVAMEQQCRPLNGKLPPRQNHPVFVRILMYSLSLRADLCILGGRFRLKAGIFYNAAFLLLPLHFQFVIMFRCSDISFQAFVTEYCYYVSVCLLGVKAIGLTMGLVEV